MLSHAVKYHKCKRKSLAYTTRSILTADTLSTTRNSIESALLRLPGELRNRIFAHVLGGYTVVIYRSCSDTVPGQYDGLKLKRRLTTMIEPYTPTTGPSSHPHKSEEEELKEAEEIREKQRVSGILTITQTCRQVYHETALLQFKSNFWQFNTVDALRIFTKKTTLHQRRAITAISIGQLYMFIARRPTRKPHMRVLLPGLRKVCLKKNTLRYFEAATTHEKLDQAVDALVLGGEEGKGVWIGCFDVRDPNAVLGEAFGFTIGSDVASSS